jgi:hypothetical protein
LAEAAELDPSGFNPIGEDLARDGLEHDLPGLLGLDVARLTWEISTRPEGYDWEVRHV